MSDKSTRFMLALNHDVTNYITLGEPVVFTLKLAIQPNTLKDIEKILDGQLELLKLLDLVEYKYILTWLMGNNAEYIFGVSIYLVIYKHYVAANIKVEQVVEYMFRGRNVILECDIPRDVVVSGSMLEAIRNASKYTLSVCKIFVVDSTLCIINDTNNRPSGTGLGIKELYPDITLCIKEGECTTTVPVVLTHSITISELASLANDVGWETQPRFTQSSSLEKMLQVHRGLALFCDAHCKLPVFRKPEDKAKAMSFLKTVFKTHVNSKAGITITLHDMSSKHICVSINYEWYTNYE